MGYLLNDASAELIIANFKICVYFFISIILFIWTFKICKKDYTNNKNKEHENVISPILAEVLIDGKIDLKNLILATITELQIKGNVAIVNDNTIELLHKKNIKIYELYLIDMIFQDKKIINLTEINDRFIYNRTYNTTFENKMAKITEEIQTELYKINVFSGKRTLLLKLAVYIAMLIFINLPILLMPITDENFFPTALLTILFSLGASIIYFSNLFNYISFALDKENMFRSKTSTTFFSTVIALIITFLFSFVVDHNFISMLGMFGIFFINICTFRMNKNNVLSDKGEKEKTRILELKNFLKEYDFRKTEGSETYIIWDKYFAYAAAFGIKNPVISEIYEKWDKLDFSLDFTKNII